MRHVGNLWSRAGNLPIPRHAPGARVPILQVPPRHRHGAHHILGEQLVHECINEVTLRAGPPDQRLECFGCSRASSLGVRCPRVVGGSTHTPRASRKSPVGHGGAELQGAAAGTPSRATHAPFSAVRGAVPPWSGVPEAARRSHRFSSPAPPSQEPHPTPDARHAQQPSDGGLGEGESRQGHESSSRSS